ncbi:hypothetical protein LTR72_012391, partial [Exophiala xenobiotica]
RGWYDLYVEACYLFAAEDSGDGGDGNDLTPTPPSTGGPPTPQNHSAFSHTLPLQFFQAPGRGKLQLADEELKNIVDVKGRGTYHMRLRSSPLGDEGLVELDHWGQRRTQKLKGPRGLSRSGHPIDKKRRS